MSALLRDNDDDDDGGGGGGGDIAASWPALLSVATLQAAIYKLSLNVEIYVVTLIIEIPQKNLPLINSRL